MNIVGDSLESVQFRIAGVDGCLDPVFGILDLVWGDVVIVISIKIEVRDDISQIRKILLTS